MKQHSHENTLWTEHGKTKNFVDEVWIMQIVTLFLIFNLKTQQRRWSVKKKAIFPRERCNTLKCTRWELFKVTEVDISFVIVSEDNRWHPVKRVLGPVFQNRQELGEHLIVIHQRECWSNWTRCSFPWSAAAHSCTYTSQRYWPSRHYRLCVAWTTCRHLHWCELHAECFSIWKGSRLHFSCTSSGERSPQGQDNKELNTVCLRQEECNYYDLQCCQD